MIDANYEERLRALQEALTKAGEKPGVGGGRQFAPSGEIDRTIVPVHQENTFQVTTMPRSGSLSEGVEVRI